MEINSIWCHKRPLKSVLITWSRLISLHTFHSNIWDCMVVGETMKIHSEDGVGESTMNMNISKFSNFNGFLFIMKWMFRLKFNRIGYSSITLCWISDSTLSGTFYKLIHVVSAFVVSRCFSFFDISTSDYFQRSNNIFEHA